MSELVPPAEKTAPAVITLPTSLADFAATAAVEWEALNLDAIRELSRAVWDFGDGLQATHDEATTALSLAARLCGEGAESALGPWRGMTERVDDLVVRCHIVSRTLDTAVTFIAERAEQAIGRIEALAAQFAASTEYAASTEAPAKAKPREAADPAGTEALFAAARAEAAAYQEAVLEFMRVYLQGKAIPLLEEAVSSLTEPQPEQSSFAVPEGLPAAARRQWASEMEGHAATLDGLAEQVLGHARAFAERVAALEFGVPDTPETDL